MNNALFFPTHYQMSQTLQFHKSILCDPRNVGAPVSKQRHREIVFFSAANKANPNPFANRSRSDSSTNLSDRKYIAIVTRNTGNRGEMTDGQWYRAK